MTYFNPNEYKELDFYEKNKNDIKYLAIDFETAGNERTSVCSMGVSFANETRIIRTAEYLVKPPNVEFQSRNVEIHGITPD